MGVTGVAGCLKLAFQPVSRLEVIVSSEDVATMVNYKILAYSCFEMLALGALETESIFAQIPHTWQIWHL